MSLARIKKNLSNLATVRKISGKPLAKLRKTEAVSVVSAIMLSDYAPSTKADYIRILREYLRWLGRPWADQIRAPKIRKGERVRERMISKEEALRIIEMSGSLRNRALLWLLYEGGLRPGEALSLRRKDVEILGDAVRVIVTGKTGTRRILLTDEGFYLRAYLSSRDFTPDELLFPLSRKTLARLVKEAARRAGVKKNVVPYSFRHLRATLWAKEYPEQVLKKLMGWAEDSDMAAVYVHLSGRDVEREVMEHSGLRICPHCGRYIKVEFNFCPYCGRPVVEPEKTTIPLLGAGLK